MYLQLQGMWIHPSYVPTFLLVVWSRNQCGSTPHYYLCTNPHCVMWTQPKILVSFRFAGQMILRKLICLFHSCEHASNLSSVSPFNFTTHQLPDDRHDEDVKFKVLSSWKPSLVQIRRSLLQQTTLILCQHYLSALVEMASTRNHCKMGKY